MVANNNTAVETWHKRLIDKIARMPNVQTTGFWDAMKKLPDANYLPDLLVADPEWRSIVRFIPDAYAITPDEREVTIFEVVLTSDITDTKIQKIMELSRALDEDRYSLGLIRYDLTGPRVYHVGLLGVIEMERENRPDEVAPWQFYTMARCGGLLKDEPAPAILEEIERLTNA